MTDTTQAPASTPSTAVQTKPMSPIEVFRKGLRGMEAEFARALPPHIPLERFLRVMTTAVQTSMASGSTSLLECSQASLWAAFMRAAQDGLLPDGREGAVIKYGDSATWVPMIAGLRKKARNSGEISTWDVHAVHRGDHFLLKLGDTPGIEHTYDLATPRGEMIGAYSVCLLKDGSKSYEIMSMEEIRGLRDRSQAWRAYQKGSIKTTPWLTDESEMARKTVAKRHAKQLPSSADLDDLIRRDDELYEFAKDEATGEMKKLPKSKSSKALLDQFADGNKELEGTATETKEADKIDKKPADDDPGEIPEGLKRSHKKKKDELPPHDKETGEIKEPDPAGSRAPTPDKAGEAKSDTIPDASPAADPLKEYIAEPSIAAAYQLGEWYREAKRPMHEPNQVTDTDHIEAFRAGWRTRDTELATPKGKPK
jgi:recombination protein RecT